MTPNGSPDYITIVEAADEIGVGVREMQRKVQTGIVPGVKRAGAWWILRTDLDAARASHERGPGRPPTPPPATAAGADAGGNGSDEGGKE